MSFRWRCCFYWSQTLLSTSSTSVTSEIRKPPTTVRQITISVPSFYCINCLFHSFKTTHLFVSGILFFLRQKMAHFALNQSWKSFPVAADLCFHRLSGFYSLHRISPKQRTHKELFPLRLSVSHNSSFPLYFTWQGSDQHSPNCKWTFIIYFFFFEAGGIMWLLIAKCHIFQHLSPQVTNSSRLQVQASFEEFSLSLMCWRNKEVEQKKTFSLSEVSQPNAPLRWWNLQRRLETYLSSDFGVRVK